MMGNGGPYNLPASLEARYQRDPRRAALLRAMQPSAEKVYSPAEAVIRALTQGAAGWQSKRLDREYEAKGQEYRNRMAEALKAGQESQDEYGAVTPGNAQRMIDMLAGIDPDLALRMQQRQMERKEDQSTWETRFGKETEARRKDMGIQNEYAMARSELDRAFQAAQQDKSFANQAALQAAQQRFAAAEAAVARGFQAGEGEKTRAFQGAQTDKTISAQQAAAEAARNAPLDMVLDPAGSGQMVPRAQAQAYSTSQGNLPAQTTLKQIETKASPEAIAARTKIGEAKDVLAILDMVEPLGPDGKPDLKRSLLEKSTGSGVGALVDTGAALFGGTTPGAEAAAKLKAIEGNLISKMPKMTGPQSDKDVLLYKQMAAQIGDPTVPAKIKRAAMQAIREINTRYAGGQDAAAMSQPGAPMPPAAAPPAGGMGTVPPLPDGFVQIDPRTGRW